jgi:hypothetical protein
MKTNYIKTPSESDHWMTKAQQRRDFLRIAKVVVFIGLAIIAYYMAVNHFAGPMSLV